MAERILLVGETNPYGANPDWALYPHPVGCSGWRLCHAILGMDEDRYFEAFDRVNLCEGPWRIAKAREAAVALGARDRVLLGRKVCDAHGTAFEPFLTVTRPRGWRALILPHPSGLNRMWNDDTIKQAREAFAAFAPEASHA